MTAGMYKAVTRDVQVTVIPDYRDDRSEPDHGRYFWAYTIEVTNLGVAAVQLVSRHWIITDGEGRIEEVKGLGVVGEQPMLQHGETFRYTSGCPLPTPSGFMVGTYRMVDDRGQAFDIAIPAFSLDLPAPSRVLN